MFKLWVKSASVKSHISHHLQELTLTHACTHINKTKNNHKAGNHKWWSCKELKREVWRVMHLQLCEGAPPTLQTTCMEPLRKFRQRIFTQQHLTYFNFLHKNSYSKFPTMALFQPQMMCNSWDGLHFCHWSDSKEYKHEEAIIANGTISALAR